MLRQVRGPHERERCECASRAGCLGPRAGLEVHQWSGYCAGSIPLTMQWIGRTIASQADVSDPKGRALKIVHGEDHAQS